MTGKDAREFFPRFEVLVYIQNEGFERLHFPFESLAVRIGARHEESGYRQKFPIIGGKTIQVQKTVRREQQPLLGKEETLARLKAGLAALANLNYS